MIRTATMPKPGIYCGICSSLFNILIISVKEVSESANLHQSVLKEQPAEQCTGDSKEYIYNIVMTRVDRCSPDACHDNREKGNHIPSAFADNGIHQCHNHICRMKGRNGSKDICVSSINGVEDSHAKISSKRPRPATLPGVFSIGSKP